jgi:hypothetical protein
MTDGADHEDATGQGGHSNGDRRQSTIAIEFSDRRSGIDRRKSARSLAAEQEHDAAIVMARKALLTFGLSSPEFAAAQSATSEARSRMAAAEREDDEPDDIPTDASAWIAPPVFLQHSLKRDVDNRPRDRAIMLTPSDGLYHRLTAYAEEHGMSFATAAYC